MVLTLFKLRMRQLLAGMVTSKKAGKTVGKGGKIALAALYVFLIIYFACMVGALCASLCLAFGETDFAWLYFCVYIRNGVYAVLCGQRFCGDELSL